MRARPRWRSARRPGSGASASGLSGALPRRRRRRALDDDRNQNAPNHGEFDEVIAGAPALIRSRLRGMALDNPGSNWFRGAPVRPMLDAHWRTRCMWPSLLPAGALNPHTAVT